MRKTLLLGRGKLWRPQRLVLLVGLSLGSAIAWAQGPGDGGGPAPAAVNAPLDGGATLLLAAGAAYGLRRLRPRA